MSRKLNSPTPQRCSSTNGPELSPRSGSHVRLKFTLTEGHWTIEAVAAAEWRVLLRSKDLSHTGCAPALVDRPLGSCILPGVRVTKIFCTTSPERLSVRSHCGVGNVNGGLRDTIHPLQSSPRDGAEIGAAILPWTRR